MLFETSLQAQVLIPMAASLVFGLMCALISGRLADRGHERATSGLGWTRSWTLELLCLVRVLGIEIQ